ncbi:hypothetical protein GOP47_0019802 [Adiantum capillus-veneris]|uniref:rRNA biogenesis protein RRP36 n=1 Tax=Adiantum capillus-veneris TaxID=13818 RepID=A0A9D4Z8Y8_ADICA|nr:hypothetical protein GOP47_0019802 [Adiantum capillus-veneris]
MAQHDSEDDLPSSAEDVSEEEDIQGQISEVPFEELQKARSNGSSSFRPFPAQKSVPKRANKNRPVEMSSKKPVGRFREVIQAPKRVLRDPRFENLCGSYEESKFKTSYKFLYDEELPAEKKRQQELLRKEKSSEAITNIQKHINWIDTQLREEQLRRKRDQKSSEQKQREKESVKQGKKPFYAKKSETRKQELIAKYKELKASGKLEAFLAKRRRQNAAKDHRYMPYRRQPHDAQADS